MKFKLKNTTAIIVALHVIFFGALAPVGASAHLIYSNSAYEFAAAVGADGHDHEHAPVKEVASDGHTDHEHKAGGSDLLVPGSARWFGLLAVSLVVTALLSYWVYRYIQVAPVVMTKPEDNGEKK